MLSTWEADAAPAVDSVQDVEPVVEQRNPLPSPLACRSTTSGSGTTIALHMGGCRHHERQKGRRARAFETSPGPL